MSNENIPWKIFFVWLVHVILDSDIPNPGSNGSTLLGRIFHASRKGGVLNDAGAIFLRSNIMPYLNVGPQLEGKFSFCIIHIVGTKNIGPNTQSVHMIFCMVRENMERTVLENMFLLVTDFCIQT